MLTDEVLALTPGNGIAINASEVPDAVRDRDPMEFTGFPSVYPGAEHPVAY